MLCPHCLQNVDRFKIVTGGAGNRGIVCPNPECKAEVPLRYQQDYSQFPPVIFSVIGFRGHGKTVYFAGLLLQLQAAALRWSDFSATPLDEAGIADLRQRKDKLKSGELPDSTAKNFHKPAIIRLQNVPQLGSCHLLVYDTSGEAIQDVSALTKHCAYLSSVPVITLLVSVRDMDNDDDLLHFLTVFNQTVLGLGGSPKKQSLVVVLTQADKFVDEPGVPQIVQDYLRRPDTMETALEPMQQLSNAIEGWLSTQGHLLNFVRRAKQDFREVKFCVLSATGSQPDGRKLSVAAAPHGVMAPVLWVMRLSRVNTNTDVGSKSVARFKDFWRGQISKNSRQTSAFALPAPIATFATTAQLHAAWIGLGLAALCLALAYGGISPSFIAVLALVLCGISLKIASHQDNRPALLSGIPLILAVGAVFFRSSNPQAVAISNATTPPSPNSTTTALSRRSVIPVKPIATIGDTAANRARQLKNAAIEEMLQTRRLTEQNLLSETDLVNQERKIKASLETALAASDKALAQNSKNETALAQKAAILFLLERFDEAREVAERGATLYPDNADLKQTRQRILRRLNSSERVS